MKQCIFFTLILCAFNEIKHFYVALKLTKNEEKKSKTKRVSFVFFSFIHSELM